MPSFTTVLPALAFGDRTATIDADVRRYCDRMSRVVTSLQYYEAIGPALEFRQKSATATINGLKLTAGVSTPVRIDVSANADSTLMVPLAGNCTTLIGGRPISWHAGQHALFLPSIARGGHCSTRSVLLLDVKLDRVQQAARAMLGLEAQAGVDFRPHQERQIDLQADGIDYAAVLQHLCGIIDALGGDAAMAAASLKLDDQFYRVMALMLHPGLMRGEVLRRHAPGDGALDSLCDYVTSRLGAPLSLTDMELFSGLSRRTLQYAFQKRFGVTPMQWVREQRLLHARDLLVRAGADVSVTRVALQCGFVNVGAFSGAYHQRFGEYPSATLRMRR